MNSMTGFGGGEASSEAATLSVELRSVNNRFCDVKVKLPRELSKLESEFIGRVKAAFSRGRIDCQVRRELVGGGVEMRVDESAAAELIAALERLSAMSDRISGEIPIELLAKSSGVLVSGVRQIDGEEELLLSALDGAIAQLGEMRATEGASLEGALREHLGRLRDLRDETAKHADGVAARLHSRLVERMERLIGEGVDEGRIAQEAAVQADKADIEEELARLTSHCDQFESAMSLDEPVGRRLEFLTQEMNREINTIGSKAAESEVTNLVVEMKTTLERLREQVANVE